jgi:putative oxidoreductase
MMELGTLLNTGMSPDLCALTLRAVVGVFFGISGYHKLFNAERHARLKRTLEEDKVPCPSFMQWWVPFWELASGVGLALGMLTVINAAILLIVCLVACACESAGKIRKYAPIDKADWLDDLLYLPEVLYCAMLVCVLAAGPGAYSIDALVG